MMLLRFTVLVMISVTTVARASSVRLHRQSRQFPGNTTFEVPSRYILNMWNCPQSHVLPTWTDCINWHHFFIVTLLFKLYFMQFSFCISLTKTESCLDGLHPALCAWQALFLWWPLSGARMLTFLIWTKKNNIEIDGFLTIIIIQLLYNNLLHFTLHCTYIAALLHVACKTC